MKGGIREAGQRDIRHREGKTKDLHTGGRIEWLREQCRKDSGGGHRDRIEW